MSGPHEEIYSTLQPDREPGPYVQADILRAKLVDFRHQADLSQGDVVKKLGISISTMHRVETGPNLPTTATLIAMLAVYDAMEFRESLTEDLRHIARLRKQVQEQYPDVPESQLAYADHEAYATQIDIYAPQLLPEFLQSHPHAVTARREISPSPNIPDWLEGFNARRKRCLLGANGPAMRILITEESLLIAANYKYRTESQQHAAIDELTHELRSINTQGQRLSGETIKPGVNPNISVQVIPFEHGQHRLMCYWKPVTWLSFANQDVKARGYYAPPHEKEYTALEIGSADAPPFDDIFQEVAASIPGPEETSELLTTPRTGLV